MIDIEQQAISTFQNNLNYFATHHPLLHKKLDVLETAIGSGQYRENYSLEYISDYFDIKELSSGALLYGRSSLDHAQMAADGVNWDKRESVIKTFYDFPYTKTNVKDLDRLTMINSWMVGTAPIVHFVNEQMSTHHMLKKIYKFIFFGVGVGVQLSVIHQKIDTDSYLIIEDNLELFRLSMFVTDYKVLGHKARLFFSVMDDPGEFKQIYDLFAADLMIRNSHLKFYLLSDSYAPKIKQIQNFAVTQAHLAYPYNHLLHKNLLVSHAIYEDYDFLNISRPFEASPFSDKPILYLAAGPSLDVRMEWVRENQKKFIIVCVFMIADKLEQEGVLPDIVVHVDEAKEAITNTLRSMEASGFLKESIFILAASVPLGLFTAIGKKENIFLIEDRTRYKKDHGFIEFFSVGEVGYALSLIFGVKEIYLLGLDLAVDQKTGKTHASGHRTSVEIDISRGDTGPESSGTLRETLITVKGNRQATVFTTPLFDASIHRINYFTRLYKSGDQKIYNLSDGAYYDETVALQVEDVCVEDISKDETGTELLKYLQSRSTDSMSDVEKNNIIIRKKEVKKKARLIERFSKQNIKEIEGFRKQFIALVGSLITPVTQETNEVSDIFLNYFQTVGNYIGNLLNTVDLHRPDKIAKELQKLLSRQLYKILHDIGSFEFDYINGKKYFDVNGFSELQSEILELRLEAREVPQIAQLYFVERMRLWDVDEERIKNSFTKDAIGLFAVEENLHDHSFVDYIKELYRRLPQVSFKLFYLDDAQKRLAEIVFQEESQRVHLFPLTTIQEVAENIEIYIRDQNTPSDEIETWIFTSLLKYSDEVFPLNFHLRLAEGVTVSQVDQARKDHLTFQYLEKFGYTDEDVRKADGGMLKLRYNKIYELLGWDKRMSDQQDLHEYQFFTELDLIVKYPEYKRHILRVKKINQIIYR